MDDAITSLSWFFELRNYGGTRDKDCPRREASEKALRDWFDREGLCIVREEDIEQTYCS